MKPFESHLAAALDRIDQRDERRSLRAATPQDGGRLLRDGAVLVDFSSNDYLGLSRHPLLAQRSAEWALAHGAGSAASRLVTGTQPLHLAVEEKIARFKGKEAALLFPSGWHCNAAVLAALLRAAPGAALFTDRLIHGSLHAGAAAHRQIRFRHNDLGHLAELLARAEGPKIIVTESVFSMDGDRADVAALADLARAHDAFLYVDEAHATGVLGPQGRGLTHGLDVDLVMGTFSKALGCMGAYVAGSRLLIDYLVNACGGFIFSTAPSPAMLGAIDAALDLVPDMEAERAVLADHGAFFRESLQGAGIATADSSTQIVPVIVGDAGAALALAQDLGAQGMLAVAIRPPTVPPGTSRLRVALHANHARADVAALAQAIAARIGR
ncbi:aminotransferase class I/II-fold pyridoxal phosphate-dependent enzyme [Novosphingobium humi]|uniref:aminotransferase class I/II-fold pyridoxal phosphate-dependent enzyme n=1 Tax=Novosphingobium humi TaxID=2282397 RepID=UPI003EBF24D0